MHFRNKGTGPLVMEHNVSFDFSIEDQEYWNESCDIEITD